jgi:hypothetical protein
MQGIEFETDNASSSPQKHIPAEKTSAMVELLLKFGVKDTAMANYILLGTAGILIGIAVFLYAGVLNKPQIDHEAAARVILLMEKSQR